MTLTVGDWIAIIGLPLAILGAWKPAIHLSNSVHSLTRRGRAKRRISRVVLIDELHRHPERAVAFGFSKLFDAMTLIGLAMLLALLIPFAPTAWLLTTGGVAGVGLFLYGLGVNYSVTMNQLRSYETTRERLCAEIEKLGGVPPEPLR